MKKRGIIFIALIIISLLSFVVVFVAENITKAEEYLRENKINF